MSDPVNHPPHYTSHPSGVECITVTEHMNFNLGNAVKYIWRAGLKSDTPVTDLRKALWYVQREVDRLGLLATSNQLVSRETDREHDAEISVVATAVASLEGSQA